MGWAKKQNELLELHIYTKYLLASTIRLLNSTHTCNFVHTVTERWEKDPTHRKNPYLDGAGGAMASSVTRVIVAFHGLENKRRATPISRANRQHITYRPLSFLLYKYIP